MVVLAVNVARARLADKETSLKKAKTLLSEALDWLARHQLPDGGWAFDLTEKIPTDAKARVTDVVRIRRQRREELIIKEACIQVELRRQLLLCYRF